MMALICHIGLILHYNFTQDDAYITFRYATNFLNGDGLVYNIGEQVEGYTNFLWTLLMILGRQLGFGFIVLSKFLGSIFGVGTILISYLLGKRIFADPDCDLRFPLAGFCCLILGAVYSFAYWAVAGLETAAFTFMVTTSLYLYLRRSFLIIPVLTAATLLRPEGGLVFVFIVIYEILRKKALTQYAILATLLYVLFMLPSVAFKFYYYGSLLPNSFYAKTNFSSVQVIRGLEYVWQFSKHYLGAGLFIIPAVVFWQRMSTGVRLCMAFILVYTIYLILIGGDVLKVHRFFVPLLPFFIIVTIAGLKILLRGKLLISLGILIVLGYQIVMPRSYVQTYHDREVLLASKMSRLTDQMVAVDNSDFSVAASTIGMLGYGLMGHTVIDLLGLTDSTIARHPEPEVEGLESSWHESHFNSPYVLSRQPDYIVFSTNVKPSAPAERALFLYSEFLRCYRTVGFYLGGSLQGIYKRYYDIKGPIERDVEVQMVQNFNRGFNLLSEGNDYRNAIMAFDSALRYSPEPKYPYIISGKVLAYRNMGDFEKLYHLSQEIVSSDTLIYEPYMNLYLLEAAMGNHEAAQYYRGRLTSLVPWIIPRLDSLIDRAD